MPDSVKPTFVDDEQRIRDEVVMAQRHKEWGVAIPAIDVDLLVVEGEGFTGNAQPVALIEYKMNSGVDYATRPTWARNVLIALADRASLPLFLVRYNRDVTQFSVVGLNPLGLMTHATARDQDELQFVGWLYALRRKTIPADVAAAIEKRADVMLAADDIPW